MLRLLPFRMENRYIRPKTRIFSVENVFVGSLAVVDGGGLAWQEFAVHAKVYGKVVRIRADARC
jgi:hypothetical protein